MRILNNFKLLNVEEQKKYLKFININIGYYEYARKIILHGPGKVIRKTKLNRFKFKTRLEK